MSKIIYLKSAFRSLKKYDIKTRIRLIESIDRIPQGDIKKLRGTKYPPLYRLRVRKYRVIYHIENENIIIVDIDTRGDVYK